MDLLIIIEQHWTIIAVVAGIMIWLVRQESKLLQNEKRIDTAEKRIDHVQTQADTMESGLVREISDVKQSLARIEGYLKGIQSKGDSYELDR